MYVVMVQDPYSFLTVPVAAAAAPACSVEVCVELVLRRGSASSIGSLGPDYRSAAVLHPVRCGRRTRALLCQEVSHREGLGWGPWAFWIETLCRVSADVVR